MKQKLELLLLGILVTFAGLSNLASGEEKPAVTNVAKLIAELPHVHNLPKLPDGVDTFSGRFPNAQKESVAAYRKAIAALIPKYAELKSLLQVGKSVFDYPGLLEKGPIMFREYTGDYELTLGVYDQVGMAGDEGELGPYRVTFDSTGKIVEIAKVDYKH